MLSRRSLQLQGFESYGYRYGFNGKEMDNEVAGTGNVYDYGFRIYNPRIGRFLSVDPLTSSFPFYSPYQFSANTPIAAVDVDGREADIVVHSVWYQELIIKAVNAGDQKRANSLAYWATTKDPQGKYAEILFSSKKRGNGKRAGTFNWNEKVKGTRIYGFNENGKKVLLFHYIPEKKSLIEDDDKGFLDHVAEFFDDAFFAGSDKSNKNKDADWLDEWLLENVNPEELQRFKEAFSRTNADAIDNPPNTVTSKKSFDKTPYEVEKEKRNDRISKYDDVEEKAYCVGCTRMMDSAHVDINSPDGMKYKQQKDRIKSKNQE